MSCDAAAQKWKRVRATCFSLHVLEEKLASLMQIQSCPALSAQTRNNFVSTKQEVEKLMKRIRSADQDYKPPGQWTMEGFLYVQEKREWL